MKVLWRISVRLFASLLIAFYALTAVLPVTVFAQTVGSGTLTASPTSGQAPLAVTFTATWLDVTKTYNITYGDGNVSAPLSPQCALNNTTSQQTGCFVQITHTYASAGSYTATVAGYTAHVTVTAAAATSSKVPPTCQIIVNPTSISVGGSVTVSWTSTNATAGAITNIGNVGPTGSINLLPSSAAVTTYFGAFTGPGGTANCQASVAVNSSGTGGSGTTAATQVQTTATTPTTPTPAPTGVSSGLVPCGYGVFTGGNESSSSTGCQACNLAQLIQNIMTFAIGIAVPIAAALFAYAGFLYITSASSPGNIGKAKGIFKDALIGFLIAICAWLIINTLLHVIFSQGTFSSGNWFTIECTTGSRPVNNKITDVLSQLPIVAGNAGQITPDGSGNGGVSTNGSPSGGGTGSGSSNEFSNSGDLGTCPAGYQYIPDADTCSTADGSKQVDPTFQSFGNKGTCPTGYSYLPTADTCMNNQDASQSADPTPYPNNGGMGAPTGDAGGVSTLGASRVNNTNQYSALIQQYAAQYNVDPATVQGIMAAESSGNANVGCNSSNACGLMQVLPATACQTNSSIAGCNANGTVQNDSQVRASLQDPATNIAVGTQYYSQLVGQFGNTTNAIASYNGGPGASANSTVCPGTTAWQCGLNSGFAETRGYVPNVLAARSIVVASH